MRVSELLQATVLSLGLEHGLPGLLWKPVFTCVEVAFKTITLPVLHCNVGGTWQRSGGWAEAVLFESGPLLVTSSVIVNHCLDWVSWSLQWVEQLGVVVHACNPSIQESEANGSGAWGQLRLHGKTLSGGRGARERSHLTQKGQALKCSTCDTLSE
jgi:hypothetical protein